MKKTVLTALLFLATSLTVFSQVGIGTTTPKAALDISSDKGLLLPRIPRVSTYGTVDGALDSNEEGLVVYNTTTNTIMLWNGTDWQSLRPQPEYLYAINNTTIILIPGTIINGFDTKESSGLSIDSNGEILLKAGITYELEAALKLDWEGITAYPYALYTWQDENGNYIGNISTILSISRSNDDSNQPVAKAFYKPTADIKVSLYCINRDGDAKLDADMSYITVKAIAGY